jgi:hypothetical protein
LRVVGSAAGAAWAMKSPPVKTLMIYYVRLEFMPAHLTPWRSTQP